MITPALVDAAASPEDWTFTLGEDADNSTNIHLAINRVFLFKGNVDYYWINPPLDEFHSESQDTRCA